MLIWRHCDVSISTNHADVTETDMSRWRNFRLDAARGVKVFDITFCFSVTWLHACQYYSGYFREPHWKSMGLPEISKSTWQLCDCNTMTASKRLRYIYCLAVIMALLLRCVSMKSKPYLVRSVLCQFPIIPPITVSHTKRNKTKA